MNGITVIQMSGNYREKFPLNGFIFCKWKITKASNKKLKAIMENKRHENHQGTRSLSGCRTGIKFLGRAFVAKDVALRTFSGNQGACGMFSGSPNCLSSPGVTPFVIMERSISIGSRARSIVVLMMVMANDVYFSLCSPVSESDFITKISIKVNNFFNRKITFKY